MQRRTIDERSYVAFFFVHLCKEFLPILCKKHVVQFYLSRSAVHSENVPSGDVGLVLPCAVLCQIALIKLMLGCWTNQGCWMGLRMSNLIVSCPRLIFVISSFEKKKQLNLILRSVYNRWMG